jgi:hypothetical protein
MDIKSRIRAINPIQVSILFASIVLLVVTYFSIRPIVTFEESAAEEEAIELAIMNVLETAGKERTLAESQIDEITNKRPVYLLPLSLIAKARVVVRFARIARRDIQSRLPPLAKVIPLSIPQSPNSPEAVLVAFTGGASLQINWDIIIVGTGLLIVAIIGTRALLASPPKQLVSEQPQPGQVNAAKQLRKKETGRSSSSAEQYLVIDVERALGRSEQLFSRSTLLLAGGVVMAFVGVAVFFVSLTEVTPVNYASARSLAPAMPTAEPISSPPSPTPFERIGGWQQLFLTFKSTAMLIFIEAIAWFLLRQYRALIEDYKSFYRYYMRRANYLAALKLALEQTEKTQLNRVVETLLSEDLTGRLKQGETTEGLEGQRAIDSNFAETILVKASDVAQHALAHTKKLNPSGASN